MFDLVANHPVATDPAFKHLTQVTMMMTMMMVMTLTMMMTIPDAADEATAPA